MEKKKEEVLTLDLTQLFKTCLQKCWLILLVAIVCAVGCYSYARFVVKPQYSSSVTLYVNNSSNSDSISNGDLVVSKSLVNTYCEILNNRSTLEQVIERANLSYSYSQLSNMLTSGALNQTEVMKVTVTCYDPDEAAKIANCIAEVLPERISAIIKGASMEVVDSAVANDSPVSPKTTKYAVAGFLVGFFLVILVLVVSFLTDGTIHNSDYVLQTYEYPVLANVPDLNESGSRRYGYYRHDDAKR